MKSPLFAKVLVATAALVIALTPGCRRKEKPITPLPARTGDSRVGNPSLTPLPGEDLSGGGLGESGGVRGSDLNGNTPPFATNVPLAGGPLDRSLYNEDRLQFAANVVYFDYDSSVIKTTEKGKITAVADFLRSSTSAAVEIEGHCDERGTEEYNRSLGERRALAVREELVQQGIDLRRVYTISYGEDRPAVDGHDEYAWSRNRRGEFVLLQPR